jgi:hypothetical protein
MYTGLVIESLFDLVERAEQHAKETPVTGWEGEFASMSGLLPRVGFELLQENTALAGVA